MKSGMDLGVTREGVKGNFKIDDQISYILPEQVPARNMHISMVCSDLCDKSKRFLSALE